MLLTLLFGATTALIGAQSGGGYDLSWWTADGGGISSAGVYTLQGTAGQADAGALSGGDYELNGGFWGGTSEQGSAVYIPVVIK